MYLICFKAISHTDSVVLFILKDVGIIFAQNKHSLSRMACHSITTSLQGAIRDGRVALKTHSMTDYVPPIVSGYF